MSKSFTVGEVKEHGDVDKGLYIIIDNGVYEMVRFLSFYCVTSSFSFFPVVLRNVVGLFYIPLSLCLFLSGVCVYVPGFTFYPPSCTLSPPPGVISATIATTVARGHRSAGGDRRCPGSCYFCG